MHFWDLQAKVQVLCFVHHCEALPLVGHKAERKEDYGEPVQWVLQ